MLIPIDWQVPQRFRDRMGERAGRQRAMHHEGHLLLVLHRVPSQDTAHREGVLYWRNPEGQWRTTVGGEGRAALKRHVEDYATAIDKLEDRHDAATSTAQEFDMLRDLAPLHRAVTHMHATLQAARESCDDHDLISARDRAGETERAADLLAADTRHVIDFAIARQSELQSQHIYELTRAGYRLNRLAAIFLPITAVGAAFGMNIEMDSGLFWVILIGSVLLGVGLHRGLWQIIGLDDADPPLIMTDQAKDATPNRGHGASERIPRRK